MKRALKNTVLVTLCATLLAAILGVLAGVSLGRYLALRTLGARLVAEAARGVENSDLYSFDAFSTIRAMHASSSAPCSDQELAFFRKILFHSHYIKEIGRASGNAIACSTYLGRVDPAQFSLPQPDYRQTDGTLGFHDIPYFRLDQAQVITVRHDDFFAVLNPYVKQMHDVLPFHWSLVSTDPRANRHIAGATNTPATLDHNSDQWIDGSYYATRCSQYFQYCMTVSLTSDEMLSASRAEVNGYIAFGGLTGTLFGILISIAYRRSRSIEQQLLRAIRGDKLHLVYQPIVELESGRTVGAEALARWTDEDGFSVAPDVFVRIAEELGFVQELTRMVVLRALRDFAPILRARPEFHLAINVTATDLEDRDFLPMVDRALAQAHVAPSSLVIEITESSTARRAASMHAIRQLRQRGHRVHIDDFGTGYSSLAYLHDLDVNAIKIDRAFTKAIGTQAVTTSILPQILAMADSLNLQTIVEGIETNEQAGYFESRAEARPFLAQGWLFGHPVSVEEFRRILEKLPPEKESAPATPARSADSA